MYRLIRKGNKFCFVEEHSKSPSPQLLKSMMCPSWSGACWQHPPLTEKEAWRHFVDSGQLLTDNMNEHIINSWQRCRSLEVDPIQKTCIEFLPEGALKSRNSKLIDMAKPIIRTLYHCLRGSDFVVVLIDSDGYILRTHGKLKSLRQADRLQFGPGANWSEPSVGTNAIGTALATRKPVQVTGVEHYCENHHLWTCAAAPIRDYSGEIIGFIDISGPREKANAQQLALAIATASAIEERICLEYSRDCLHGANKYLEAVLNSVSDGIVATNANGIITAVNRVAAKIYKVLPDEIIGKPIKQFVEFDDKLKSFYKGNVNYSHESLIIKTHNGKAECVASANPIIQKKGVESGAVFTICQRDKYYSLGDPHIGTKVKYTFANIIGKSQAIRRTVEQAKQVACSPSNILIVGESGTGKELVAQAIHVASDFRNGPFVSINCGAIAKELIQSELFGYTGGAFTGASRRGAKGKFEMANGGTLFLDEIGEMPFEMQVNLLRVLEERTIVPVGGKKAIAVNVRIIAATNKSLYQEVAKGAFREDLYYRLNVISISLPPLRARKDDIKLLVDHHIESSARKLGKNIRKISPAVIDLLQNHDWPGNIRELVNAAEYAVNFVRGDELKVEHLPRYLRTNTAGRPPMERRKLVSLRQAEQMAIENALRYYKGNISRTAKALGIGRNTLYDKIKKYGI
jgi:transcriptional regulator of acetoin/glycerol metabolism